MEVNVVMVLRQVITGPEIIALVSLMAANVALSIIAAIAKGEFSFRNLGDFVVTRVLPLITYVIVAMLASFIDSWTAVVIAVYAGLVALYGAGIIAAIKALTGVNIPKVFTEKRN